MTAIGRFYRWGRDPRRTTVVALGLYLAFATLDTLPLALHFTTHMPGSGGDAYQYLWNLWLVRRAFLTGSSPLQTDLAFWPDGVKLYTGFAALLDACAAAPVLLLFGPIVTANVLAILKPALNALAAFALARYLWGGRLGPLLAGIAFGFCPYVAGRGLAHPTLTNVGFMAFGILWLLQAVETGRARHFVLFALATLVCFSMLHYALYLAVFVGLFVIWQVVHLRRNKEAVRVQLWRVLLAGACALIACAPFLLLFVSQGQRAAGTPELARAYGADLLAYVVPSPFHPLWGALTAPAYARLAKFGNLVETVVFPGYGILVLAGASLLGRRELPAIERRCIDVGVAFWSFIALSFFVLSLGIELRIDGRYTGIPLPYAALNRLPLWSSQNAPSRWGIMVGLALCMLAAAAVGALRERRRRAGANGLGPVLVAVVAVVVVESWWAPYGVSPIPPPSPFFERMARDPERYAVLDVAYHAVRDRSVIAQMTHGKPTIGGYALPPLDYLPAKTLPPFYELYLHWPSFSEDVVAFDLRNQSARVLHAFGVRYVLVHRASLDNPYYRTWAAQVISETGLGPAVYRDDTLEAYRVPEVDPDEPVVVLTRYFEPDGKPSRLEPPAVSSDGLKYREIVGGSATFGVWSSAAATVELALTAWNAGGETVWELDVGGRPLRSVPLGREPRTIAIPLPLKKGTNALTLRGQGAISRVRTLARAASSR